MLSSKAREHADKAAEILKRVDEVNDTRLMVPSAIAHAILALFYQYTTQR